jgi:hypothetical protein
MGARCKSDVTLEERVERLEGGFIKMARLIKKLEENGSDTILRPCHKNIEKVAEGKEQEIRRDGSN